MATKSTLFINNFINQSPTNLKLFYTTKPIIIQFLSTSKTKQKQFSQQLLKIIPNNFKPNSNKIHLIYNKLIQLNKLLAKQNYLNSNIQLATKNYLYQLSLYISYQLS